MALIPFCGFSSPSSTLLCLLSLTALVLVCSCSYSSSFDPTGVMDPLSNTNDDVVDGFVSDDNNEDDRRNRLLFQPLPFWLQYLDDDEQPISSKDRLIHILKSSQVRHHHGHPHINNRRYAPQSFHA